MVFEPCKTGDLSLLRSILASSIAPAAQLERRDSSGKTPLMRAIKYVVNGRNRPWSTQMHASVFLGCTSTRFHRTGMVMWTSSHSYFSKERTCKRCAQSSSERACTWRQLGAICWSPNSCCSMEPQYSCSNQITRGAFHFRSSAHETAPILNSSSRCVRVHPSSFCMLTMHNDLQDTANALSNAKQVAAEQHTAAHHTKDNAVQGTFNMWSQQALGLDPIREERTSSEASSGRRSLQTINFAQPSGGLDAADLFWFASDRRRSTSFEPMYFDPSTADCGIDDAAAPLHRRRSFDARLAQKPQRRASFDADRMQHKHQERTGDPVALAAAAAVSHAVQARASFESARASFDLQGGQGGQRRRTSMDATAYTGRRSCSHEVRQEPYVRRDWCIE